MKCLEKCRLKSSACKQKDCRYWIDYKKELNCMYESIDRNGSMTLREIAERIGVSYVRIKQIEDKTIKKIKKHIKRYSIYDDKL